ncbi:MAG: HlyD family efflux transporter periplasmic adaptor subunit [Deltaproteobacteria bacterium]|nr:HlyD family efflux transporter periplasmic adaptor subunit [Deltaproteobacteria bacterium]
MSCSQAQAGSPEPLQGVVELDEKVLGFELGGRVLEIGVDEGGRVGEGSVVARLDGTLDGIAREARAAEVAAARGQLDLLRKGARREDIRAVSARMNAIRARETLLERNLARQRTLVARGASAAMVTDELEAQLAQAQAERAALNQQRRALASGARDEEVRVAEARLAASEAALRAADERLARSVLRADGPATVLRVHVDPGEVVAPGAPVITVADIDHPYVDVFVPQAQASQIRVGIRATIRIDAERRPFRGRVEHIGRRTEFTPRYLFSERERPNLVLRVRVRVDDPRHALLAGVPAFVVLQGADAGPGR